MRSALNRVQEHAQVEIGALQPTGLVSAAATWDGLINGKQRTDLTNLTITVVGKAVQVGQTLLIAGTTSYNGLHPIIKVIDATHVVIDFTFVADESGTWGSLGAKGFFVGFIPKGQVVGASITSVVYHKPNAQHGDMTKGVYESGVPYYFPGIITEITLSADDMTLLRYSNNNPQ